MKKNLVSRDVAGNMDLSMYEGEPCRVCGINITDATKAVYAGCSADNKSRSAHKSCWNKNLPKSSWAYPQDAS